MPKDQPAAAVRNVAQSVLACHLEHGPGMQNDPDPKAD
jgi:hypothetical protein